MFMFSLGQWLIWASRRTGHAEGLTPSVKSPSKSRASRFEV
jgi:hypothetical protein